MKVKYNIRGKTKQDEYATQKLFKNKRVKHNLRINYTKPLLKH